MTMQRHLSHSELFLLRIWKEEPGEGCAEVEWRGKLQRAGSGESRSFTGRQGLIDVLSEFISEQSDQQLHDGGVNIASEPSNQAGDSW